MSFTNKHNHPSRIKDNHQVGESLLGNPFNGIVGEDLDHRVDIETNDQYKDDLSEDEYGTFLLGLYIFGDDLATIKKFLQNESMNIESYYNLKFVESCDYERWEVFRKMNSRYVGAKRTFFGLKAKDLLTCIPSNISEECQAVLHQVSKKFMATNMSVEDWLTLKVILGADILLEAANIRIAPPRDFMIPDEFSSLTIREITYRLHGRLSKTTSRKLFWGAVWPRLRGKGWHLGSSKENSLIFLKPGYHDLLPGLIKGKDYYGSIHDLLNIVAKDPDLIRNEEENENQIVVADADIIRNEVRENASPPRYNTDNQEPTDRIRALSEVAKQFESDEQLNGSDAPLATYVAKNLRLTNGLLKLARGNESDEQTIGADEPPSGNTRNQQPENRFEALLEVARRLELEGRLIGSDAPPVRYTTRNRQPTNRLLEAVANGFISPNPRPRARRNRHQMLIEQRDLEREQVQQEGEMTDLHLQPRQNARNRTPTTRLLEAMAHGLFTGKSGQKRQRRG